MFLLQLACGWRGGRRKSKREIKKKKIFLRMKNDKKIKLTLFHKSLRFPISSILKNEYNSYDDVNSLETFISLYHVKRMVTMKGFQTLSSGRIPRWYIPIIKQYLLAADHII